MRMRHADNTYRCFELEAASIPSNAEKPNIKEWLIAGGKRFKLPLSVHSGVEDYFGSARADGKVHSGVDFSLTGLKNVPVDSPCEGIVSEVGTDETLGTHVIVDCGGNFKAVLGWLGTVRVGNGNNVSKSTTVGVGENDLLQTAYAAGQVKTNGADQQESVCVR